MWQRVGTLGFFLDRIWRLAGGRTELHDEALASIDREHAQIEYFNYKYKLKAARMADIHQIHDFMKRHEVSVERLCDVRRWFSLSPEPALSSPSRAWQITATVAGLVLYVLMNASFGAIAFNKTYAHFREAPWRGEWRANRCTPSSRQLKHRFSRLNRRAVIFPV